MPSSNAELSEDIVIPSSGSAPVRALVVLNSLCFYGLERNVIETFDCLRPAIEPVFFIQQMAVRYQTQLFSELKRRGFKVDYFSDSGDWPRVGKPKSLKEAFRIMTSILRANRDLWKAAQEADFIYVPTLSGLYYAFCASAWLRFHRRKVIYSFQDLQWEPSRKLRLGALWVSDCEHLAQRSLEMAVAANPYLACKRNHVIAPVIDLSGRVSEHQASTPESADRIILFVGQVAKHKGIDLLIEAFVRIAPDFPSAQLHIVGGADYEYGGDFQKLLDSTGLSGRIRSWGYVNDVEPFFRSAYVYVQPSLPSKFHESFGRSAVEAMSVGTPIVCFRSGALAEVVEHDLTGWICNLESADSLAQALARLLSDSSLRNQYSKNCIRRFQQRYSKDQVRRRWQEMIAS